MLISIVGFVLLVLLLLICLGMADAGERQPEPEVLPPARQPDPSDDLTAAVRAYGEDRQDEVAAVRREVRRDVERLKQELALDELRGWDEP